MTRVLSGAVPVAPEQGKLGTSPAGKLRSEPERMACGASGWMGLMNGWMLPVLRVIKETERCHQPGSLKAASALLGLAWLLSRSTTGTGQGQPTPRWFV